MAGTAFMLNAWIEAEHADITDGLSEDVALPTPSGGPYAATRCASCGMVIWGTFGAPIFRFVRAGTLDHKHGVAPDVHIYTSTKQA
ncbi:MAG: GFA family protein, partial [Pseudomonadota bacterium]